MKPFATPIISACLFTWLLTIMAGSILFDTFVLYPNIFHDVPASLALAKDFLTYGSPGNFFPPLGSTIVLCGLVSIGFNWRNKPGVHYQLVSFVLFLAGEFAFSVLFFWPKNKIMFIEGLAVHSEEVLIATADSFRQFHWLRVGVSVAASIISFWGLVRYSGSKVQAPVRH